MKLRRGAAAAGDALWPWPPPIWRGVPRWHRDRGFKPSPEAPADYPTTAEGRLRHDLTALVFRPGEGFIVKVLYYRNWAPEDHPLARGQGESKKAWGRKLAAACAEAVYTLVGEC